MISYILSLMYVILHFTWPCTERLLLRLTKFLQISICKKEKKEKENCTTDCNTIFSNYCKFNYIFTRNCYLKTFSHITSSILLELSQDGNLGVSRYFRDVFPTDWCCRSYARLIFFHIVKRILVKSQQGRGE